MNYNISQHLKSTLIAPQREGSDLIWDSIDGIRWERKKEKVEEYARLFQKNMLKLLASTLNNDFKGNRDEVVCQILIFLGGVGRIDAYTDLWKECRDNILGFCYNNLGYPMSKNRDGEGILVECLGRLEAGGYLGFEQMKALGELIGINGEKFREQAVDDFSKYVGDDI